MTKLFIVNQTNSDFEKQVVSYFREYMFFVPEWCHILNVEVLEDADRSGSCNPVMHNGFATIQVSSQKQDEMWVRNTVLHEIAHLYTYPDLRFVLVAIEELDIEENAYKILRSAAMDRHESCTQALTELFEKVVIVMKKCGTKKGSAKPNPFTKKGK